MGAGHMTIDAHSFLRPPQPLLRCKTNCLQVASNDSAPPFSSRHGPCSPCNALACQQGAPCTQASGALGNSGTAAYACASLSAHTRQPVCVNRFRLARACYGPAQQRMSQHIRLHHSICCVENRQQGSCCEFEETGLIIRELSTI